MRYYETDIRQAGGKLMILRKERSYIFFADHVARLFIQDWDVLVSLRIYPRGYGKIMALLADEKRTDQECIRIQKEIDEYMSICYMLDCNHVKMNHVARLGIEVRYGRLILLALALATAFYVRAIMANAVLNIVLACICIILAIYSECEKRYRIRNCIVDDEYIEDIRQKCKRINPEDSENPPIYVHRYTGLFRRK